VEEPGLIPPGHGEEAGPERPAARCPRCAVVLQNLHPASRADGRWEGWCEEHGTLPADYRSYQQIIQEPQPIN
jgi:hypothetical protein